MKIEAPGSPNISVTTGATSMIVRWDPPAYDGGSIITGYLVEIINGTHGILITNSTTSGSSSLREVKIGKLRKHTNYTVRVKARNVVSYGKAAEIFTKTKFVGGYNCDICHFTYQLDCFTVYGTVWFIFCHEVQCPDRWPAKSDGILCFGCFSL